MPPRIDDAVTILTQKVAALSKELQELRPYRAIADVEAEIAAKKEAFAQKVQQLKQAAAAIQEERDKLARERAALEAERAAVVEEKEKTTALARALMARVAEHTERIRRETGEAIFREYERIGDERYALQQEMRRLHVQTEAETGGTAGTTEVPVAPEPAEALATPAPETEATESAADTPDTEETAAVAESNAPEEAAAAAPEEATAPDAETDEAESPDEEEAEEEAEADEPAGPKIRLVRPTKKRRRWR